jgi:hypothetical protein
MSEQDLIVGQTYYHLTFADRDWTMPGVKPMVYVGKNIFGAGSGLEAQLHYFQDTTSVVVSGLATGTKFDGDAQVVPVPESELGVSVLSLSEVVTQVTAALARATSLGNPRLSNAPGKWR